MPSFRRYFPDSTVSRELDVGDYALDAAVYQTGKPLTDADLNISGLLRDYDRRNAPGSSGFLGMREDSFSDFLFYTDDAPGVNTFGLTRQKIRVAGAVFDVVSANTTDTDKSLIRLGNAPTATGTAPDAKGCEFVYLEVWKAALRPAHRASGTITIATPFTLTNGDTISVAGTTFTARTSPSVATDFAIGSSPGAAAGALASAINTVISATVTTSVTGAIVTVRAVAGGTAGNALVLATTNSSAVSLSGATLAGGTAGRGIVGTDQVYRNGATQSPSGLYISDGMIDPAVGIETSARVQIRYRFVAVSVDGLSHPMGFTDSAVQTQPGSVAYNFVPADGVTVNGDSSATAYGFVDNGLWIAGNGTSTAATNLDSVDGYRYAIPVAMVRRFNNASGTGGFDPANNANGALPYGHTSFSNTNLPGGPWTIAVHKSDRPDGKFCDIITSENVVDLRRSTATMTDVTYQMQTLLDGGNRTWAMDGSDLGTIGNGSGDVSPEPLCCDEIGRNASTNGNFIRRFDHIARRFSATPILERVVFSITPTTATTGFTVVKAGGSTGWHEGDTIQIDFSELESSARADWTTPMSSGRKVSDQWPTGTKITDVVGAWHDDGHSVTPVNQGVQFQLVEGLGTDRIKFTLDPNGLTVNGGGTVSDHAMVGSETDNGSQRRIFIELEVSYPAGSGLRRTPIAITPSSSSGYAPYNTGSAIESIPAERSVEIATGTYPTPYFRDGVREVYLSQRSGIPTARTIVTDTLVTRDSSHVRLPRRISTTTNLVANGAAPVSASVGNSTATVTLATGHTVSGQNTVAVSYWADDPIPDAGTSTGYATAVYYRARAPQTIGARAGTISSSVLPSEIPVTPLGAPTALYVGTAGAGSVDRSFPYARALEMIPTEMTAPGGPNESYFSGFGGLDMGTVRSLTGLVTISPVVTLDISQSVTVGYSGAADRYIRDAEDRIYYPIVNHNGYQPYVLASGIHNGSRHKAWCGVLARAEIASAAWRKGEVLLLVFSSANDPGVAPGVTLSETADSAPGCAAIYRTRNLLTP